MRVPDRFWWVQRTAGVLLVVFGAGVTVWIIWNLIWNFPNVDDDPLLADLRMGLIAAGCGGVLFALQGAILFKRSLASRSRFQCRLAAISGQQDAIPPALINVDPSIASAALIEPIELIWRATSLNRRVFTILFAILFIVFGALAVIGLYLLYVLVATGPTKPITPIEYVIGVVLCVVYVGLAMAPIVLVGIYLPAERGRPYWVKTSDEGITSQPQVGRQRSMRWEDMRLLEITGSKFTLYGRDATLEWSNTGPNNWVETGTTDEEFSRRHLILLDMVAARTGLVPRTFNK